MEISSVQHQHQAMASNQVMNMEDVMVANGTGSKSADQNQERKPRPQPEQALKCPRCESTNTKFCYYNNYSLSQPRYFCKGCRRYWTQGGSLRNVPVGGGSRKNSKRSSSSSSKKPQDHQQTLITTNSLPIGIPPLSYAPTDSLSLSPFLNPNPNPNPSPNFLDILRSGFLDSANPAGFSNLCSGYGFDGGLGLSCPTTTTAAADDGDQESKMVMGHQWQFSDGSNNSNNVGVDHHSARDYYNWHGIINSSLM